MPTHSNGHTPAALRWGRYVRVSSEEQAGPDSASIEVQLRDTQSIIEREGGALIDTYCDNKAYPDADGRRVQPSGERADRPEFQRMLADLRSGRINAIVAWHEWRLYRDFRPFVDLIEVARVKHPTVRLFHGQWAEQFAVFGAWMGKADNDHRRIQLTKGRRSKAEKGFSPSIIPPFYATVRDDKGKRVGVVLRPEYRAWLDELARLFVSGLPYNAIAQQLGTNPATGKRLGTTTVAYLLKNKFMFGLIEIDKSARDPDRLVVPGLQPPAWDEATCAAIRAEHARRAARGQSGPHGGKYPFTGIVRCGYCGKLMSGLQGKARQRPYYGCHRRWLQMRGYLPGEAHPPNHVSEQRLIAVLQALGQDLTPVGLETLLLTTAAPRKTLIDLDHNARRARDELAEIEAELALLPATSRRARTGLEEEHRYLSDRLAVLEQMTAQPVVEVVSDERRASIQVFFGHGDLAALSGAELRALVVPAWEALYFKHGELVAPPVLPD